jgi:hypothetical protein
VCSNIHFFLAELVLDLLLRRDLTIGRRSKQGQMIELSRRGTGRLLWNYADKQAYNSIILFLGLLEKVTLQYSRVVAFLKLEYKIQYSRSTSLPVVVVVNYVELSDIFALPTSSHFSSVSSMTSQVLVSRRFWTSVGRWGAAPVQDYSTSHSQRNTEHIFYVCENYNQKTILGLCDDSGYSCTGILRKTCYMILIELPALCRSAQYCTDDVQNMSHDVSGLEPRYS